MLDGIRAGLIFLILNAFLLLFTLDMYYTFCHCFRLFRLIMDCFALLAFCRLKLCCMKLLGWHQNCMSRITPLDLSILHSRIMKELWLFTWSLLIWIQKDSSFWKMIFTWSTWDGFSVLLPLLLFVIFFLNWKILIVSLFWWRYYSGIIWLHEFVLLFWLWKSIKLVMYPWKKWPMYEAVY